MQGGMGWCAVVCMIWWGSDVICDAMVLMVWLVSHSICAVGACAGWVLVIMARLVRRCGMALGAATAGRLFGSCVGLASGAPGGNHIAQS